MVEERGSAPEGITFRSPLGGKVSLRVERRFDLSVEFLEMILPLSMGLLLFRLACLLVAAIGGLLILFWGSAFGPFDLGSSQWEDLSLPREVSKPQGVVVSHGRDLGGAIGDWTVIYRLEIPAAQMAAFIDSLCTYYGGQGYDIAYPKTTDCLCSTMIKEQNVVWWRPEELNLPHMIDLTFKKSKGLWLAYSSESGVVYLLDWAI
jgi:hypothetical protein